MKPDNHSTPIFVNFVALGCAKNLVDSEKMIALMAESGMALVGPDDEADACIINTCGFIEDARTEALDAISQAIDDRNAGRINHVIVTGCLAQHWAEKLAHQVPGIDAIVGLAHRGEIARIVRRVVTDATDEDRPMVICEPATGPVTDDRARLRLTDRCWAYLRISEGCDQNCTFCTIPAIRGPFRSKKPEAVLAEAAELVADGAVELNLIGQETTGYGSDLDGNFGLAELMGELNQLEGLRWLRLLYAHPASLTDHDITALARCDRVVPYIDLPLQHINDRILRLMNRRITRRQTEQLIERLRQKIDNLTIRTTMLVGFPSETDRDFNELLDFVHRQRFEALGCFCYSAEPGTPAARLNGSVAGPSLKRRHKKLMLAQQEIAFGHADSLIGHRLECLIINPADDDEIAAARLDTGDCWFIGRHPGQAAEIDGVCFVRPNSAGRPKPGSIVKVTVEARCDYDLVVRLA